jgi:hypothetical protein
MTAKNSESAQSASLCIDCMELSEARVFDESTSLPESQLVQKATALTSLTVSSAQCQQGLTSFGMTAAAEQAVDGESDHSTGISTFSDSNSATHVLPCPPQDHAHAADTTFSASQLSALLSESLCEATPVCGEERGASTPQNERGASTPQNERGASTPQNTPLCAHDTTAQLKSPPTCDHDLSAHQVDAACSQASGVCAESCSLSFSSEARALAEADNGLMASTPAHRDMMRLASLRKELHSSSLQSLVADVTGTNFPVTLSPTHNGQILTASPSLTHSDNPAYDFATFIEHQHMHSPSSGHGAHEQAFLMEGQPDTNATLPAAPRLVLKLSLTGDSDNADDCLDCTWQDADSRSTQLETPARAATRECRPEPGSDCEKHREDYVPAPHSNDRSEQSLPSRHHCVGVERDRPIGTLANVPASPQHQVASQENGDPSALSDPAAETVSPIVVANVVVVWSSPPVSHQQASLLHAAPNWFPTPAPARAHNSRLSMNTESEASPMKLASPLASPSRPATTARVNPPDFDMQRIGSPPRFMHMGSPLSDRKCLVNSETLVPFDQRNDGATVTTLQTGESPARQDISPLCAPSKKPNAGCTPSKSKRAAEQLSQESRTASLLHTNHDDDETQCHHKPLFPLAPRLGEATQECVKQVAAQRLSSECLGTTHPKFESPTMRVATRSSTRRWRIAGQTPTHTLTHGACAVQTPVLFPNTVDRIRGEETAASTSRVLGRTRHPLSSVRGRENATPMLFPSTAHKSAVAIIDSSSSASTPAATKPVSHAGTVMLFTRPRTDVQDTESEAASPVDEDLTQCEPRRILF